jgi:hypothetical protein
MLPSAESRGDAREFVFVKADVFETANVPREGSANAGQGVQPRHESGPCAIVVVSHINESTGAKENEYGSNHDESFKKLIRNFYLPFLIRLNKLVILLWIIALIVCLKFGPSFLSSTSSDISIPKGTPIYDADAAFQSKYPNASK